VGLQIITSTIARKHRDSRKIMYVHNWLFCSFFYVRNSYTFVSVHMFKNDCTIGLNSKNYNMNES
jgi:hypothetical protein